MKRVTEPLKRMGASFVSRSGGLSADFRDRRAGADADPLRDAGILGPGEIGDSAGRPQRAGPHDGRRTGPDPRPHRAAPDLFRRRRWTPGAWSAAGARLPSAASPSSRLAISTCRAIRPLRPFSSPRRFWCRVRKFWCAMSASIRIAPAISRPFARWARALSMKMCARWAASRSRISPCVPGP